MLKVGLTGNIGSGKTLVASIFQSLGVPVFHADLEARLVYNEEEVINAVRNLFGNHVISASGEVMRKEMASIVFSDPVKLEALNRIIHPLVRKRYLEWRSERTKHYYTLYEAAILFETGFHLEMDKVICITAPAELRAKRVMERDNLSKEEVHQRMRNQWDEEQKIKLADYIIANDEKGLIMPQVIKVHYQIINFQKSHTQ